MPCFMFHILSIPVQLNLKGVGKYFHKFHMMLNLELKRPCVDFLDSLYIQNSET